MTSDGSSGSVKAPNEAIIVTFCTSNSSDSLLTIVKATAVLHVPGVPAALMARTHTRKLPTGRAEVVYEVAVTF